MSDFITSNLNASFYYTFYFLLLASMLSIITSFTLKNPNDRKIIFVELAISSVASYMYYLFIRKIDKSKSELNDLAPFRKINILRYNGWSITTPLMLYALCLILSKNSKIPLDFPVVTTVILLDYIMLLIGYLGETQIIDRSVALVFGFLAFFSIFYCIYKAFLNGRYNLMNYLLFGVYFIFWSIYGVVFMMDDVTQTFVTNILDCISKAFVAIGISANYLSIFI
jgi:bacteriorhodopsin